MRPVPLLVALALLAKSAAAQVPQIVVPGQTAMPSPDGTMPSANQVPHTNLPRADGTMAVTPAAIPPAPLSPLCKQGAMTGPCNPIPNPQCLPGQAVTPAGQRCATPMTP